MTRVRIAKFTSDRFMTLAEHPAATKVLNDVLWDFERSLQNYVEDQVREDIHKL